MAPLKTLSETAKNYKDALSELKMNSKPIITSLTMLATEIAKTDDDEAKTEARNIANVIETRVVEKARDSRVALATLYVLDSIAKNCRDPYASVFAPHVAGVFLTLFAQTDEKTKKLMKIIGNVGNTKRVSERSFSENSNGCRFEWERASTAASTTDRAPTPTESRTATAADTYDGTTGGGATAAAAAAIFRTTGAARSWWHAGRFTGLEWVVEHAQSATSAIFYGRRVSSIVARYRRRCAAAPPPPTGDARFRERRL